MLDRKALSMVRPKFHCMASGERRMQPCAGCPKPAGCATKAMQYKETETPVELELNAKGEVQTCAKGLNPCGYQDGKLCGQCGAVAKRPAITDKPHDLPKDASADVEVKDLAAQRQAVKEARLETLGVKAADVGDDAYLCAFERKVLTGTTEPCAGCPGGCAPEAGLPTLLEVEGIVQDTFGAKVLDSGYGDRADMFIVQAERGDGEIIEVLLDGTTAKVKQLTVLDAEALEMKTAADPVHVVGMDEAAEIAVKSVEGEVVGVDADQFEGHDTWVVQVDTEGKSFDVYVALSGKVLGYDEYTAEEAADIDAQVAELSLKAAYTPEDRERMAENGEALPDGSFPIATVDDLRNAIQAFGRASDQDAAKAHIIKRARALDAVELLPEDWTAEEKADGDNEKPVEEGEPIGGGVVAPEDGEVADGEKALGPNKGPTLIGGDDETPAHTPVAADDPTDGAPVNAGAPKDPDDEAAKVPGKKKKAEEKGLLVVDDPEFLAEIAEFKTLAAAEGIEGS